MIYLIVEGGSFSDVVKSLKFIDSKRIITSSHVTEYALVKAIAPLQRYELKSF